MPTKSFKIFLNGKEFLKKKFDNNSSLSEIRERIKDKLDSDFNFLDSENFFIDKEDEDGTTIEELKTDDSINIQLTEKNIELKKEIEYNIKPKNIPIEGSNPLKNEGELKIYKYPIVEFTSTEEAKAFVMLVVGETGSGKTSFINTFVNYLMGIDVSDDFRDKLIMEEERKKCESQTKG
jgi:polynucleotide 5'-kinase involved in rRNA processing